MLLHHNTLCRLIGGLVRSKQEQKKVHGVLHDLNASTSTAYVGYHHYNQIGLSDYYPMTRRLSFLLNYDHLYTVTT